MSFSLQRINLRQAILFTLGGIALVLIGMRIQSALIGRTPDPTLTMPKELIGVLLPSPRDLQPFSLIDHHEKPFAPERLQGRWTFIFFGYTHCPDVCPLSMGLLAETYDLLGKTPNALSKVQSLFVSVDTERDSPEQLKNYVPYFNPDFLGLTGKQEEIHAFAKQLGAYYSLPTKSDKGDESQLISHSSVFFVIDPAGKFTALFQPQLHQPATMAELFLKIRKHYGETL
ncbi:MAG: SCO family protein [Magnetococcus sp. YQC-9]